MKQFAPILFSATARSRQSIWHKQRLLPSRSSHLTSQPSGYSSCSITGRTQIRISVHGMTIPTGFSWTSSGSPNKYGDGIHDRQLPQHFHHFCFPFASTKYTEIRKYLQIHQNINLNLRHLPYLIGRLNHQEGFSIRTQQNKIKGFLRSWLEQPILVFLGA